METLVGKLPNLQLHPNDFDQIQGERIKGVSSAYSRALYDLMLEIDPHKQWGGLNCVLTPEGEYLWLCAKYRTKTQEPVERVIFYVGGQR